MRSDNANKESSQRKERPLLEPIETTQRDGLDDFPELDEALKLSLARLEPRASQIPENRDSLERFRRAHYPKAAAPTWWQRCGAWLLGDQESGHAFWSVGAAGAAAFALLLLMLPSPPQRDLHPGRSVTAPGHVSPPRRAYLPKGKGYPQVPQQTKWAMLFAKANQHPGARPTTLTRKAGKKEELAPKDLIQFTYQTPKATRIHVMVVNVDQKGNIGVCTPFQGTASIQIEPGKGTIPPKASMELDHNTGYERFLVFYGPKAFTFDQVKKAFQGAWKKAGKDIQKLDALPGPWSMRSFLIHKQTPRKKISP